MINLAGETHCDQEIAEELDWAGIIPEKHDQPLQREVPASLTGYLVKDGKQVFKFVRDWYYWVVEGNVPLNVAQDLYTNRIGKKYIRVMGADSPPPEKWAIAKASGQKVIGHYHIDTQRGLNLFVETLKAHKLVD